MLIVREPDGSHTATPILIASVTVEHMENEGRVRVVLDSEPGINPGLSSRDGLGLAFALELGEAIDSLPEGIDAGSSLRTLISTTAETLNLTTFGGGLSIDSVEGIADSVIQLATQNAATASLLKELEALEKRNDWRETAAASLIDRIGSMSRPTSKGVSVFLGPLSMNNSQELMVRGAMKERLTVTTGPPGTGKSQVVVNIVANCFAQGESVLVTSTNNAAVDVAVDRANSLVPGSTLRTGNRDARERLPSLITGLVRREYDTEEVPWARIESAVILAISERNLFFSNLSLAERLECELLGDAKNDVRLFSEASLSDRPHCEELVATGCQWPISSTRWWPAKVPILHAFFTSSLTKTDLPWLGLLSSGTTHRS